MNLFAEVAAYGAQHDMGHAPIHLYVLYGPLTQETRAQPSLVMADCILCLLLHFIFYLLIYYCDCTTVNKKETVP